jgi:hypothetical protein
MIFGSFGHALLLLAMAGTPSDSSWRLLRTVQEFPAGAAGASPCALVSPPTPLDKDGEPSYGSFFLVVTGNSTLSLDASNVGLFFNGVSSVVLRAGSDSQTVAVRRPVEARPFLEKLAKPSVDRVAALVQFAAGDPARINFSLKGFAAARAAAAKCLSASASPAVAQPGKGTNFSLASFLQSPIAKKYGIAKSDGWPLKDGTYGHELGSPGPHDDGLDGDSE